MDNQIDMDCLLDELERNTTTLTNISDVSNQKTEHILEDIDYENMTDVTNDFNIMNKHNNIPNSSNNDDNNAENSKTLSTQNSEHGLIVNGKVIDDIAFDTSTTNDCIVACIVKEENTAVDGNTNLSINEMKTFDSPNILHNTAEKNQVIPSNILKDIDNDVTEVSHKSVAENSFITEVMRDLSLSKEDDEAAHCNITLSEKSLVTDFIEQNLIISGPNEEKIADTEIHNSENVELISDATDEIPCTSTSINLPAPSQPKSVIESTYDMSVFKSEFKLTESELQIGKSKPYWIPDMDCVTCMLCSAKFTLVNRRHHCRCCGRVLCGTCCQIRRVLPYMYEEEPEPRKQRVCDPCNKTLDRIEAYEKFLNEQQNSLTSNSNDGNANLFESGNEPRTSSRKKSVLKVRTSIADATCGTEVINSPPIVSNNDESIPNASNHLNAETLQPKRKVIFRDGVKPGTDHSDTIESSYDNNQSTDSKRLPKRLSRKTLEKRMDEEFVSLLRCEHIYCIKNCESELCSSDIISIWREIEKGMPVTLAIRRNLHAVVQITDWKDTKKVLSVSTRGFNSLGVEELIIIIECSPTTFDLENCAATSICDLSNEENEGELPLSSQNCKVDKESNKNHDHLCELLAMVERIFGTCILPSDENSVELDDRLGIRRCSQRMCRFYKLQKSVISGIEAAAIYLMRPLGQFFGSILLPNVPFFVGILFNEDELLWGSCLPDRVLYAIGKKYSSYPTVVCNRANRTSVLNSQSTKSTVLKVLNDFRHFTYRIVKMEDSFVSLMDTETHVIIPKWAVEEVKMLIETNRNMFGWSLGFNAEADSHLTCYEEKIRESCNETEIKTHIFSNNSLIRKVTGASFIIFDGALRTQTFTETFIVSIVEDGVIVRMNADTMETFVKNCEMAEDFELLSSKMRLTVRFCDNRSLEKPIQGQLCSPIDALNLTGKYQYGLVLIRALRSLCQFPSTNEWALRLASVINLDTGKFPIRVQSKFFETCEQLTAYICYTLDPYLHALIITNQKTICVRIHISNDLATYETASWLNLEDQHEAWIINFDEYVIPLLYGICPLAAISASDLNVELQLQIVSIRQLNFCCVPLSARSVKHVTTLLTPQSFMDDTK